MKEKNESETIGEEMPKLQAEVREILQQYKNLGGAGKFGAAMIENSLRRADEALISGDIIEIVSSFKDLQEIQ